jgi:alkylation response protein AidB-like acyl-CoA dehydrogenase
MRDGADDLSAIRESVRALCAGFPGEYWRELDRERAYPTAFVAALTEAGFLAGLIPEQYGGSGLSMRAAAAIMEEIHAAGCNGAACHAQMYTMGTVLRHGSDTQKREYLPDIARGALRLQAFGVTEPTSGTDTLSLRTTAVRDGDDYVINGQKIWTSRAEHSDLMLLLARTMPRDKVQKRTDGLSVFLIDMRSVKGRGLDIRPIRTMMNHATTEVFFDNMRVPASSLVGEEGKGFRYILSGMNAERILIAAECIGDAKSRKPRLMRSSAMFSGGPSVRIRVCNSRSLAPMRRCAPLNSWCARPRNATKAVPTSARRPTWRNCSRPMRPGRRPTCACRPTAASDLPRNTMLSANSAKRGFTRWRQSRPI